MSAKGYEQHYRQAGDWHEWSVGTGEAIDKGKPSRLFVRVDVGETLISLTHDNVTSFAPTSRQLGSEHAERLILSRDDVAFLLAVLPKVLKALEAADDDEVTRG